MPLPNNPINSPLQALPLTERIRLNAKPTSKAYSAQEYTRQNFQKDSHTVLEKIIDGNSPRRNNNWIKTQMRCTPQSDTCQTI